MCGLGKTSGDGSTSPPVPWGLRVTLEDARTGAGTRAPAAASSSLSAFRRRKINVSREDDYFFSCAPQATFDIESMSRQSLSEAVFGTGMAWV